MLAALTLLLTPSTGVKVSPPVRGAWAGSLAVLQSRLLSPLEATLSELENTPALSSLAAHSCVAKMWGNARVRRIDNEINDALLAGDPLWSMSLCLVLDLE